MICFCLKWTIELKENRVLINFFSFIFNGLNFYNLPSTHLLSTTALASNTAAPAR